MCIVLLFAPPFNSLDQCFQGIKMKHSAEASLTFLTLRLLATLWGCFPFYVFCILLVRMAFSKSSLASDHFPKHKYWVMPLNDFHFTTYCWSFSQVGPPSLLLNTSIIFFLICIICALLLIFPSWLSLPVHQTLLDTSLNYYNVQSRVIFSMFKLSQ